MQSTEAARSHSTWHNDHCPVTTDVHVQELSPKQNVCGLQTPRTATAANVDKICPQQLYCKGFSFNARPSTGWACGPRIHIGKNPAKILIRSRLETFISSRCTFKQVTQNICQAQSNHFTVFEWPAWYRRTASLIWPAPRDHNVRELLRSSTGMFRLTTNLGVAKHWSSNVCDNTWCRLLHQMWPDTASNPEGIILKSTHVYIFSLSKATRCKIDIMESAKTDKWQWFLHISGGHASSFINRCQDQPVRANRFSSGRIAGSDSSKFPCKSCSPKHQTKSTQAQFLSCRETLVSTSSVASKFVNELSANLRDTQRLLMHWSNLK